jgi:hypothetical protein
VWAAAPLKDHMLRGTIKAPPRRQVGGRMIKKWLPFSKGSPWGGGVELEEDDPDDPPVQESQASYLRRLGLLSPGEERRLKKADLAPEILQKRREPFDVVGTFPL